MLVCQVDQLPILRRGKYCDLGSLLVKHKQTFTIAVDRSWPAKCAGIGPYCAKCVEEIATVVIGKHPASFRIQHVVNSVVINGNVSQERGILAPAGRLTSPSMGQSP